MREDPSVGALIPRHRDILGAAPRSWFGRSPRTATSPAEEAEGLEDRPGGEQRARNDRKCSERETDPRRARERKVSTPGEGQDHQHRTDAEKEHEPDAEEERAESPEDTAVGPASDDVVAHDLAGEISGTHDGHDTAVPPLGLAVAHVDICRFGDELEHDQAGEDDDEDEAEKYGASHELSLGAKFCYWCDEPLPESLTDALPGPRKGVHLEAPSREAMCWCRIGRS